MFSFPAENWATLYFSHTNKICTVDFKTQRMENNAVKNTRPFFNKHGLGNLFWTLSSPYHVGKAASCDFSFFFFLTDWLHLCFVFSASIQAFFSIKPFFMQLKITISEQGNGKTTRFILFDFTSVAPVSQAIVLRIMHNLFCLHSNENGSIACGIVSGIVLW